MLPARTYSVSIDRPPEALYAAIWQPDFFPNWASGLAQSTLRQDGEVWIADGPDGRSSVRFTPHNAFGVMDHDVHTADGIVVHVPLRVVANGDGSEVMLTLFRQPGVSDEKFSADAKWIVRDLRRLKALIEGKTMSRT